MVDKEHIDRLLVRLPEVESRLSDPETVKNQRKFRELLREHANLKKIDEKARRYLSLRTEIDENRALADDGAADAELKDLAREERLGWRQ